jgi:ATP-binding cassette subfamily B protein
VQLRSALYDLSAKGVNLLGYFAIMYLLFEEMMSGSISVGAFGAVIFSVDELYSLMEEAIVGRFGSSSSKIPKIQNYFDFLQSEEEARGEEISDGNIPLQGVSFKYPKSDKHVLEDISLSISDGEIIAIVGENGAGKTTLAKLLLGIFEPCAGSAAVGGCASGRVSYQGISAVFQDFNRYRLSVRDNVKISDCIKNAGDPEILGLLEEFDLDFESHDLNTLLSREFGGTDISYGKWQRLAIARGIYRDNKILVLDEPTSAIDPLEESYIFDKFKEISVGRTTIIITHRLSLVRFVDRIIVLKDGRIVGFDSHENLLEKSEYYRTMWTLQSERYLL